LAGEKCVNCDENDKMVIYWCFLYIKIWISTTILKRFLNGYHQQKLVGGFNPSENISQWEGLSHITHILWKIRNV
jgi:hypothetical protein